MQSASYYQNLLSNANVQAALNTIRKAEGATYNTLFGGSTFNDFSWHPLEVGAIKFGNSTTSAAGAYQFERKTWENLASALDLPDFSPINQDIGALALIDGRGALQDVLNGNIASFVNKCKAEWQSFTVKSLATLTGYWNGGGGAVNSASSANNLNLGLDSNTTTILAVIAIVGLLVWLRED